MSILKLSNLSVSSNLNLDNETAMNRPAKVQAFRMPYADAHDDQSRHLYIYVHPYLNSIDVLCFLEHIPTLRYISNADVRSLLAICSSRFIYLSFQDAVTMVLVVR